MPTRTRLPSGLLALGYGFIPTLALAQSGCYPYTLSFNNVAELASQTSILFSSMTPCSGPTIAASSSASAATTSIPPPVMVNPCDYKSDPSQLLNPGFECSNLTNFGWNIVGASLISNPSFAHGGSNVLSLRSTGLGSNIYQLVNEMNELSITVQFWARLMVGDADTTDCTLSAAMGDMLAPSTSYLYNGGLGTAPTTDWTLYEFSFIGNGLSQEVSISWNSCDAPTTLYVDDFTIISAD